MPQLESVGLPRSSEFIKLPSLTKPRPGGIKGATLSINQKKDIPQDLDSQKQAIKTPSRPP